MFAPVALAILTLVTGPSQQPVAAAWGQYEWDHGAGPMSRHQFQYGATFPSGYFLDYGARAGSFYWLIFATEAGSAHFWDNGRAAGSAYFWRNGHGAGSRRYWQNGRGCLSEFGWRNGTSCSAPEAVVFQTLCIAEAVDLPPCDAINARLEDWLERSPGLSTGDLSASIARMRDALD